MIPGDKAKPLNPRGIVTTREIATTNMVGISALIGLLMENGPITKGELMERCRKLRRRIRGRSVFVSYGIRQF